MRGLAFALLVSAALDWPTWWLDRAGVALVGLAFAALALPPQPRRIRRPAFRSVPPATIELDDEPEHELVDLPARISDYLQASSRPT